MPAERRTKIVCTLGPAVKEQEAIRSLVEAGMNVARLNFSHGTHDSHREMIEKVRAEAKRVGRAIPILQDLQGPKIRVGPMHGGGVLLHKGQRLVLSSNEAVDGTSERVHVSYPPLAEEVVEGGRILIDDGHIELQVLDIRGGEVYTEVVVGGPLRSNKGVNLPDIKSTRPSLTEKDLEDLAFGLAHDVEFVALSFVRSGKDVTELEKRIQSADKEVEVIAKIEKPEAVSDFPAILKAAYGIMVARGDLGIEIPMQDVPIVQKKLIRDCLEASKPSITATQMLDSMIENPRPTRAEATDVANAVLDGSDALMLSGETAVGKYPAEAVRVMDEIICSVETSRRFLGGRQAVDTITDPTQRITEAISYEAVRLAEEIDATAICCLTHSGSTARAIASHRPEIPIFAFTDNERTVGRTTLTWGARPLFVAFQEHTDSGIRAVHRGLLENGYARPGDLVVITAGLPLPAMGLTNMVHASTVGQDWV